MTSLRKAGAVRRLALVSRALVLGALAAPVAARGQSPDWTAILTVRPNPSPYLADWQSDPTMVTLVLSYSGAVDVPFFLDGAITRGTTSVASGRSAAFEFVRPSQLMLTTRDGIWETGSVQYDAGVRSQLESTGRIPEGDYQFCVDVRGGAPESGGTSLLARVCEPFTITAPEPPSLVAPADGDTARAGYPTFAWTPVIAPAGIRVSYHVRIAEVLPGQSPLEGVNNIPQYEADLSTTSLFYPPEALPLRDSTRYVWQVQALDPEGAPLGERQGKSEVFGFTYAPTVPADVPIVVAQNDSTAKTTEKYVSTFRWSGVDVKVLKVSDSSLANYSGSGRLVLIKGVFEPRVGFHSLHLTADGKQVAYAPRHLFGAAVGDLVGWDELLKRVFPVLLMPDHIEVVADSATGDHHVGITGSIGVQLPSGIFDDSASKAQAAADSATIADAEAANAAAQSAYDQAQTEWGQRYQSCVDSWRTAHPNEPEPDDWDGVVSPSDSICNAAAGAQPDDPALSDTSRAVSDSVKTARAKLAKIRDEQRYLLFHFVDVRVSGGEFGGRLVLARKWKGSALPIAGLAMTLYADSTYLDVSKGVGTLNLKGDFTIPPSTGLVADSPKADTVKSGGKTTITVDSAITLKIQEARFSTQGELYVAAAGIPRARIGRTGLRFETGNTWIDLSSTQSPAGRDAGWQGIYLDSARVYLPNDWIATGGPAPGDSAAPPAAGAAATTAAKEAPSVVGYKLAIDGAGFDGNIYGSRLARLGMVQYAGFGGRLDSLHFRFTRGTLDTGYVRGAMRVPFLSGDMPYWVSFTPEGVGRAYAEIDSQKPIDMPALHAKVIVQRARFDYVRPVGTLTMDAKLTLDQDGIALDRVQVYGLAVNSEGALTLGTGWAVFDAANEGSFKNFPVALDSIGVGSGASGNEVWLGVAGRFRLGDDLPASAGVFRVFARRGAVGSPWEFERLAVDKLDIDYQNGAVAFRGALDWMDNDPIYGSGFKAGVKLGVNNQFQVDGNFIVGTKTDTTASAGGGAAPGPSSATAPYGDAPAAASSFRYWYVDAKLRLPPPGIQLGQIPLAIYGFGGGAYQHMRAQIDTLTLAAKYVPDPTVGFGLKALITIGTSAANGYVWNADATLEAALAPSGALSSLTLRGDNWMLTDVQQRQKRIWGTVFVDLPVSRPVFQANATLNVNVPPAVKGNGWAELHFEPDNWYVNVGTRARPDSLTLYPGTLNLASTSYFMMDRRGVSAGFATALKQEKKVGAFYGKIDAGFAAEALMRYRPFFATGDGELWGDVVAKVKGYTILDGEARASMAFQLPDPTKISGRVRLRYKLLGGTLKGTYKMRYSWSTGGDADDSDASDAFVLVAATYPATGDSMAAVNGATFYLGMSEGDQYGLEDGSIHRLRLSAEPTLATGRLTATSASSGRTGSGIARTTTTASRTTMVYTAVASSRDFNGDRSALTVMGAGFAPLLPGVHYRATAPFVLEKLNGDGSWTVEKAVTATIVFTTSTAATSIAQYVAATDPGGSSSRLYYGGPNRGAVRVEFTNTVAAVASGAVVGMLRAGDDSVAGNWSSPASSGTPYAGGITLSGATATTSTGTPVTDPRVYAFRPSGDALQPSSRYRLSLVASDSTRTEEYGVDFTTSRYASLADHLGASTPTVTPTRGPGPVSGTGSYLLAARVSLQSDEPMQWDDITAVDVVGYPSANVTTRTRCTPPASSTTSASSGTLSPYAAIARFSVQGMCGSTPTYENIFDITFAADADAALPPGTLATLTLRVHHRREGTRDFTYTVPQPPSVRVGPVRRVP